MPDVWRCVPTQQEWDDIGRQLRLDADENQEEENETMESEQESLEPTHYSQLDPKTMKVIDLRRELGARGLGTKGLKSQLIARLTKTLKTEAEKDGPVELEGVEKADDENYQEKREEEKPTEDPSREERSKEGKVAEDKAKEMKEEKKEFVSDVKIPLPDSPTILVQPSKTAKGGRFDCTVMSLSILLDYRQEDNKEHSFEVSLFAELFNEMLIRDFGFNIYRALAEAPEPKDEKDKKREKKESGKDREDKKGEKKDERKEDRKSEKKDDRKDKKDDGRKEDRKIDYEQEDSDMFSDISDGDYDFEGDESKERKLRRERRSQLRTVHKHLLLSFIYFDQNQCGYLIDRDVEDILYVLGLKLSRGQARRMLQKVIKKEMLFYRRLTDKYFGGEDDTPKDPLLDVHELAQGNRKLVAANAGENNSQSVQLVESSTSVSLNSGVVYYDGAILDVSKLLKQVERSEKARTSTENKLKDLLKELGEVRESSDVTRQNAQKTQGELDQCKRKLECTELELQTVKKQSNELFSALQNCHQHLQATLSSLDTVLGRSTANKEFKLEVKVEKPD